MYHLLVREDGWSKGNQLAANRVFETRSTRPELIVHFVHDGALDVGRVLEHPLALLASETKSSGEQNALVCRIKSVYSSMGTLQIDYEPVLGIPPIPNWKIEKLASELDLDPFPVDFKEMERTHWSVKNVDLFEVLFRDQVRSPQSSILKFSPTVDPKLVAVMMPFEGFNDVYEAIKQAATSQGLDCKRADQIWANHKVMDDITELISGASVVICDFTKRNPNVFYETGIAHAIGKKFIPITQSKDDVPFDLLSYRYLHYLPNGEGLAGLTKDLSKRLAEIIKER